MFNKLRNRFLLINVIAIVTVLFSSYLVVFFMTLNNVTKDVSLEFSRTFFERHMGSTPGFDDSISSYAPPMDNDEIFNLRTMSFWISLDSNKNIVQINRPGFFALDNMAFILLEKALAKSKDTSYFKYNDNYYAYQLLEDGTGYKIAFVDITNNVNVLLNFVYAFLLVSLLASIIIIVFSKYAADHAIKPIKETYDKQKRFISDASHELKTPLTIINANADLIFNNRQKITVDQEKSLNYIKNEGKRMTKLINDLLFLSKTDQERDNIIFNRVDFSEVVENSILSMEAVIFERKIKLEYKIEPYLYVLGNIEQLKQVILILMDNAIKYCDYSGIINVALTNDNREIVLMIENTGQAIDKRDLENIFERFYRADESRNKETGGFGLGLSIAKSIINNHKGKITIYHKGGITTASISLIGTD